MNMCPYCDLNTAGEHQLKCPNRTIYREHGAGSWTWHPLPVCVVCGKQSEFTAVLPYGSDYDGEHLCAECVHRLVDSQVETNNV